MLSQAQKDNRHQRTRDGEHRPQGRNPASPHDDQGQKDRNDVAGQFLTDQNAHLRQDGHFGVGGAVPVTSRWVMRDIRSMINTANSTWASR